MSKSKSAQGALAIVNKAITTNSTFSIGNKKESKNASKQSYSQIKKVTKEKTVVIESSPCEVVNDLPGQLNVITEALTLPTINLLTKKLSLNLTKIDFGYADYFYDKLLTNTNFDKNKMSKVAQFTSIDLAFKERKLINELINKCDINYCNNLAQIAIASKKLSAFKKLSTSYKSKELDDLALDIQVKAKDKLQDKITELYNVMQVICSMQPFNINNKLEGGAMFDRYINAFNNPNRIKSTHDYLKLP